MESFIIFYRLCKQRDIQELFEFKLILLETKKVYSDKIFSNESVYGKKCNDKYKIENLYSCSEEQKYNNGLVLDSLFFLVLKILN